MNSESSCTACFHGARSRDAACAGPSIPNPDNASRRRLSETLVALGPLRVVRRQHERLEAQLGQMGRERQRSLNASTAGRRVVHGHEEHSHVREDDSVAGSQRMSRHETAATKPSTRTRNCDHSDGRSPLNGVCGKCKPKAGDPGYAVGLPARQPGSLQAEREVIGASSPPGHAAACAHRDEEDGLEEEDADCERCRGEIAPPSPPAWTRSLPRPTGSRGARSRPPEKDRRRWGVEARGHRDMLRRQRCRAV